MRILLVSPAFHGYWRAIAGALQTLGHDVVTHRYDDAGRRQHLLTVLAHRVPSERVASAAAESMTDHALTALHEARPDAVLVVKGDALTARWWDALASSGTRTAAWLYDELERMSYDDATLGVVDTVFSYSKGDAAALAERGLPAVHLPDGFDSLAAYTPQPRGLVNFVGARYPERERLMRVLSARGIPVAAWGREWSRNPWDVLRTRKWKGAGIPAHGDLSRNDYYGVMAGSLATLNVHGNGHDGLSMRTFEAPGVGGLQLIDRPDVADHYDVGTETLVFTSDDELVDHVQRAQREPGWARSIREAGRRRTLAEHTLVHRMQEVVRRWA
ncbi:spore maturation protein [Microbacterium bovistercoris]|uniref:Spore maturation protein n=1 Tax=Microbacterium bovistercoris TaxID=2293570 RepID=A0A371NXM4_9MICO|nr:glycosyltransferase [Microbacterium bovistercoris]REJ08054.1 spore maturation protein [Microbacterium bovistercoris]